MTRNISFVGVPASKVDQRSQLSAVDLVPKLVEHTDYISVGGSATTLTYGSWIQLISSTQYDTTYLSLNLSGVGLSAIDTSGLVDLAIGASGSEQIIINSIPSGYALNTTSSGVAGAIGISLFFPVYIPKNSRISARLISLLTNDDVNVTLGLFQDITGRSPRFIDTYGADTANARGTFLPTSNTYVQITSSTTRPYRALIMAPSISGNTVLATERSTYTLAIGSSGNEVVVGTMNVAISGTNESLFSTIAGPSGIYTGHFPIGTRIACKQSVGRSYRGVIVYGVPYA